MKDMDVGIGFYIVDPLGREADKEVFHCNVAFPPPTVGDTLTFIGNGPMYKVMRRHFNYRMLRADTYIIGIQVIVEPV